jgi:hypothetical protein
VIHFGRVVASLQRVRFCGVDRPMGEALKVLAPYTARLELALTTARLPTRRGRRAGGAERDRRLIARALRTQPNRERSQLAKSDSSTPNEICISFAVGRFCGFPGWLIGRTAPSHHLVPRTSWGG